MEGTATATPAPQRFYAGKPVQTAQQRKESRREYDRKFRDKNPDYIHNYYVANKDKILKRQYLSRHKRKTFQHVKLSDEEREFILQNYGKPKHGKMTASQLQEEIGCSKHTIYKVAHKNGVYKNKKYPTRRTTRAKSHE